MKRYSLVWILAIFQLTSCFEIDISESEKSGITFMTSPDDNLILNYVDTQGVSYDFWGEKDELGLPISINQITIVSNLDTTQVFIDNFGRPVKAFSQDRTRFDFDWISNTEGAVSVLSSDGLTQVNTQFDLANKSSGSERSNNSSNRLEVNSRHGKSIQIESLPSAKSNDQNLSSNSTGNVKVLINSCNADSKGDDVWVIVKKESKDFFGSDFLDAFPAKQHPNGHYEASIPMGLTPVFDLADYVKASLKVFENVCTIDNPDFAVGEFSAFQVLCAGLGALVPQVFLACEGLAFAFTATCLVGEALKMADVGNSEFLNRKFQEDIILYPKVYSSIPYQIGNSKKANPNGPFPDLFVDLGAKTGLRTLIIDPAFPQDGQDYRAVADFKCLTSGSLVEISVLGSDGYQDKLSFSISATQPDKSYVLTVPGADSGVRDDINLVVKDLNGLVISRKASIVFN